jgi:hypothetical protein
MTKEEIDIMWQKAMQESIKYGELFTRYHFAKLVAEKEREACAKVVEDSPSYDWHKFACETAFAIRARGQA